MLKSAALVVVGHIDRHHADARRDGLGETSFVSTVCLRCRKTGVANRCLDE